MAVRIRLQRFGRKQYPFYHVVVADSRSPRDGKFIERIGSYNPNTNPASIEIDADSAVRWLNNGAQPSETARAILSYKGILFRKHLERGVRKGILTQEDADKKLAEWMDKKAGQVTDKVNKLNKEKSAKAATTLDSEKEKARAKAAAILEKRQKEMEALEAAAREAAGEAAAAPAEEAPAAETTETNE